MENDGQNIEPAQKLSTSI